MSELYDLVLEYYADCDDDIKGLEIENYNPELETLVIIDDFNFIIKLFKKLVKRYNLEDKLNILYVSGDDCGFKLLKSIHCLKIPIKVDYIISDIMFGRAVTIKDKLIELNGVSLVGILKKHNPDIKYLFISGHVTNKQEHDNYNKLYQEYSNGDELKEKLIYKDTSITRNNEIFKRLFEDNKDKYIEIA